MPGDFERTPLMRQLYAALNVPVRLYERDADTGDLQVHDVPQASVPECVKARHMTAVPDTAVTYLDIPQQVHQRLEQVWRELEAYPDDDAEEIQEAVVDIQASLKTYMHAMDIIAKGTRNPAKNAWQTEMQDKKLQSLVKKYEEALLPLMGAVVEELERYRQMRNASASPVNGQGETQAEPVVLETLNAGGFELMERLMLNSMEDLSLFCGQYNKGLRGAVKGRE